MQYLTVSALNKYIKNRLETDTHLQSIYIKGEISNFKHHSRGHLYFTLKDEFSQLQAIMFSSATPRLNFKPKEGDHVLIAGKLGVYEQGGSYSLQVYQMTLDGVGELYQTYEQRKKDLEALGYFDQKHKKEIKKFPKAIGVITSSTGAVIQDILHTVQRRYPYVDIFLYPALVQGQGSKESLVKQLKKANEHPICDTLIIGRGGGSIEDLWSFNELEVAMAIFESKLPVITAIGHETDYTISDFISDLRAPTPTAAAELATPNVIDLKEKINDLNQALTKSIKSKFEHTEQNLIFLTQRLDHLSPATHIRNLEKTYQQLHLLLHKNAQWQIDVKTQDVKFFKSQLRTPLERLETHQKHLQYLNQSLQEKAEKVFEQKQYRFQILKEKMRASNPLEMMDKGFVLIKKEDQVIRSITQVEIDDHIDLVLKDGQLKAKILEKEVK
mgnify:CR=1 FL=1